MANRIELKTYSDNYENAAAGGTVTPGHLVVKDSSGDFIVNASAGGYASPSFAVEDDLQGNDISDNYTATNQMQVIHAYPGDEINALFAAGEDIKIGDFLESAGDGTLREETTGVVLAVAIEDVDAASITSLTEKVAVTAATTAALATCTYDNGTAGLGATLTCDSSIALAAQDGVILTLNQRLLVQDQVSELQNGIYQMSTLGVTVATATPSGVLTFGAPSNGSTVVLTNLPNESATPVTFTKVAAEAVATISDTITYGAPSATDTIVFTDLPAGTETFTNVDAEAAATPSTTLTFGSPSNGDTVVFTGLPDGSPVTFTKQGSAAGNDFLLIGDLTTLINAETDLSATDNGTVITITVDTTGVAMNGAIVSGTGAYSALNITFSGGVDAVGVDEFSSITELTALIQATTDLTATDNGTIITVVVATTGVAMNSATVTGTGAYVALSETFSGGVDAPGATEFATIVQLTALIHAETDLTATDDGTDITMVVVTPGLGMNSATVTGTTSYSALSLTFSGGATAVAWVLTRATDNDTTLEFVDVYCDITSGTTQTNTRSECTNAVAPTMGTTAITWAALTGAVAGTHYAIKVL